ncbi:MAG: GAF domain-containing protein, partial [Candidatus Binataceae bacterium]
MPFTGRHSSQSKPPFLAGGGECGALIRAFNWTASPLGPPAQWPDSLRAAVRLVLDSLYPMLVMWGPDYVMLYNDGYRELIGVKHPAAIGARGRQVFPEIWDVIGPMLQRTYATGESSWTDDRLVLLERSGYAEECYFTWSFSPIRDFDGGVRGVFAATLEKTSNVLGKRQSHLLRELATRNAAVPTGTSMAQVCGRVSALIGNDPHDFPFALIYLIDGAVARLAAQTGLTPDHPASPARIDLFNEPDPVWPLAGVLGGSAQLVTGLERRLNSLPSGPWTGSPTCAYLAPIAVGGEVMAVLIAGLNPHRAFDHLHREFIEHVADHVVAAISNCKARTEVEASRERLI